MIDYDKCSTKEQGETFDSLADELFKIFESAGAHRYPRMVGFLRGVIRWNTDTESMDSIIDATRDTIRRYSVKG